MTTELLSEQQCVNLASKANAGDSAAARELFNTFRDATLRYIDLRVSGPLRSRADPQDLWQETMIEAHQRLGEYLERRPMPFRIWLVKTAQKQITRAREKHLLATRRQATQQVAMPEGSSLALAQRLISISTPSQHAMRNERGKKLAELLAQLPEADRELLLLRHFEDFSFREIAEMLEMKYANVRQRHVRLLLRLREDCKRYGIDLGDVK